MKHTEEQMLAKAKKILIDLQGQFYKEKNLKKVIFHQDRIPIIGEFEGKEIPCWVAVIDEPVFDTSVFLTISDVTGEPLYIQSSHKIVEIEKDINENYHHKEN